MKHRYAFWSPALNVRLLSKPEIVWFKQMALCISILAVEPCKVFRPYVTLLYTRAGFYYPGFPRHFSSRGFHRTDDASPKVTSANHDPAPPQNILETLTHTTLFSMRGVLFLKYYTGLFSASVLLDFWFIQNTHTHAHSSDLIAQSS